MEKIKLNDYYVILKLLVHPLSGILSTSNYKLTI